MRSDMLSRVRLFGSVALWAVLPAGTAFAQSLGLFESHGDVGPVRHAGDARYDPASQTYQIEGSGYDREDERDAFHFVWRRLAGDFILRAEGHFPGAGAGPHSELGWAVRSSLEASAAHVRAAVRGDGLAALQFRRTPGARAEAVRSAVAGPDVLQLTRRGDTFTLAVARFGEPLVRDAEVTLPLGDTLYVGLFVGTHDDDAVARFRNVRIVVPAPDDLVPYQDYLGSNLEILEVETGHREVVYRAPGSIQAPNWTPDGRALIYNADGRLYRFDLETRTPHVIDTGFATANNNDHVLSFDGRMLGISHHSDAHDGQSIVYTVPVEGGTPVQVTPTGPSYLHGWSPDGRYLVYTALRGGDYDVYRIPAGGGEEVRLTDTPGLDDGPEYSPDGQYIYFNSVRSGTMQLWRMRPDGSRPEQLTDDGFNNWFPHVSPDGRWVVFLSYGPEVAPDDHPFYKEVYLRMIPAGGGVPRVVAYVYGGQGTINVPSWSPDSRKVAFVSNTGPLRP